MKFLKLSSCLRLFIFISGIFLFSQCADDKYGFSGDIEAHFGKLKYQSIDFPEKVKFGNDEILVSAKGRVRDSLQSAPMLSWYMIANSKGEIGGLYVGSENTTSMGSVAMTADDFIQGSMNCWGIGNIPKRDKCLSDLYLLALMECVLASDGSSGFSCQVDCWMNNSQCF